MEVPCFYATSPNTHLDTIAAIQATRSTQLPATSHLTSRHVRDTFNTLLTRTLFLIYTLCLIRPMLFFFPCSYQSFSFNVWPQRLHNQSHSCRHRAFNYCHSCCLFFLSPEEHVQKREGCHLYQRL